MNRQLLGRLLVFALLVLGGFWLASVTEWVEVEVHQPPRGEAARDDFFAAQQIMKQLGVHVERRHSLDAMPPQHARLILTSRYWDLFPDRQELLRRWVENGGHLVLSASMADDPQLQSWLPVALAQRGRNGSGEKKKPAKDAPCRQLIDSAAVTDAHVEGAGYRVCAGGYWKELQPKAGHQPDWALESPAGIELLRTPVGHGSVTVYAPWALMQNDEVLREDHALVMAAALQLERGALVWLVAEETREQLLAWVWQKAWPAVVLALIATAAWLWRSAVRFGPLGSMEAPQRRSMREQVVGTGNFLQQHGAGALHAAQVRALLEMARAQIPGFASMGHAAAVQALAKASSLEVETISRALKPAVITPRSLAAALEVLETVRRRISQVTAHHSS